MLDRRGLLKRGLWGGALLALGGGGFLASRATRRGAPPKGPLRVLDEDEYAIVQALAARVVNPPEGWPTVEQVDVAGNVDQVLSRVDEAARKELRQLLGLFENALAGFLLGGRPRPFTALEPAAQDQVLHEWRSSRLVLRRTGYQAVHTLMTAVYYGSPLCWRGVGYPGPPEGFHQPGATVWRGGAPRPEGNGVFHAEAPTP